MREPKNIVICCDGTGNKFGKANSNVVKLYTCLAVNQQQMAYYHPGVGTMGNPNRSSWWARECSRIAGLAFGSGFKANLADAYKYLMEVYEEKDRIYLFGFSRGAYTVRALAGVLHMYGLLCPGNDGHLPYLLEMFSEESRRAYKKPKVGEGRRIATTGESDAFRDTFSRVVPIHFIGIWDTVSSIGWIYDPIKLLFDGQNPIIRKGRHAISVDERRCFYQANLWGPALPPAETPILTECTGDANTRQDILQAWFAGVHSDVGGSYQQDQSGPAMSALRWILEESELDGLQINPAKRDAVFGKSTPKFKAICDLNPPAMPDSCLHKSLTWKWWILELFPHKYFDEAGAVRWRYRPWPHRRDLPDRSLIHPSLRRRFATDKKYRPENLACENIQDFSALPNRLAHPQIAARLQEQGFGVYIRTPLEAVLTLGESFDEVSEHEASEGGKVKARKSGGEPFIVSGQSSEP